MREAVGDEQRLHFHLRPQRRRAARVPPRPGVARTRYARFSGFALSPRPAFAYAKSLVSGRPQHFNGHKPLGSWAMRAPLLLLGLTVASGIAMCLGFGGNAAEDVHEAAASSALALVAVVAMFWAGAFSPPGMQDNPALVAAATQAASGREENDD